MDVTSAGESDPNDSEDSTIPPGATISTGTPASFASSFDFLLAPHISSRMRARGAGTGVRRSARRIQRTLTELTAAT